jgi:hypothetical protein
MPQNEFSWNPSNQRYRFTSGASAGQFASRAQVEALTEKYISQSKDKISDLADLLIDNRISTKVFETAVAAQLKEAHINSYALGKGGVGQLTQRDYGIMGAELKKEYQYLRNFAQEIKQNNLSPDQIRARLAMYADALHGSRELGKLEGHRSAGYVWERRSLHSSESCTDCIRYQGQGWMPLGVLPNPGDRCRCRSRCRCSKSFSKDLAKPTDSLLIGSWGWAGQPIKQRLTVPLRASHP